MIGKMLLPRERLGAVGAAVWGLARMLPHMVRQVLLAGERLRTERALVGGFTSVLTYMVH